MRRRSFLSGLVALFTRTPLPALPAAPRFAGDLLFHGDGSRFVRLPKGANGQILSIVAGVPAWVDT